MYLHLFVSLRIDFTDACSGKESRDKSFSLGHKKRGNYIPIILGICAKYHPELHPKLSTPRMIGALCQSLLELASVSLKGNCLAPLTALDIIGDGLDVFFPFINISKLIHVLFSQFSPKHSEVLYKIFHKLFSPGMIETHSELVKIFIHDHLSSRSIASFQATISFLLQMLSKSPVSLSAALPYFIDAIMKLLDPSFMEIREKVLPLCSKFLYACFKTYPFIDFHSEKQKYAVANDRGPIVIYDLKTGTKSFVLESSICARASVISLSPDANHVCALTNRVSAANMEKPKTAHSSYRSVCVWRLSSSNILSLFATSTIKPCLEYAFGSSSSANAKGRNNPETLQLISKDDRIIRPSFTWQNANSFTLALRQTENRNIGIQFHI